MIRRMLPQLLVIVCLMLPVSLRAETLDAWAKQRSDCWELRKTGQYEESFRCLYDLWESKRDEMSPTGKIDTLEKLARLYVIHARQPEEAKNCFRYILENIDRYFVPEDFDRWNVRYREPLLAAYAELGLDGEGRSPEVMNVALLDFVVADLVQEDEVDLEKLQDALPDFLSVYLSTALRGVKSSDGEAPMRVVGYQERARLLAPVRAEHGVGAELSTADIKSLGQQQVVQAFLTGSVIRYAPDRLTVALRLTSTETALDVWGGTREGKPAKLFEMLQDLLREMAEHATEGGSIGEKAGAAELGPMAAGVRTLQFFHEAMLAAEDGRYNDAIDKTQLALNLSPDSEVLKEHLSLVEAQQAQADLALQSTVSDALPAPTLQ